MHTPLEEKIPAAALDAIDLGILGALRAAPRACSEIVSFVQCMAGQSWRPAPEIVSRRLIELAVEGFIERFNRSNLFPSLWFAVTEQGQERLRALLVQPVACSCLGVSRAQVSMKVLLLDELSGAEREAQLDELIAWHENELLDLRGAMARCPEEWHYVHRWMRCDLERVQAEIMEFKRLRDEGRSAFGLDGGATYGSRMH